MQFCTNITIIILENIFLCSKATDTEMFLFYILAPHFLQSKLNSNIHLVYGNFIPIFYSHRKRTSGEYIISIVNWEKVEEQNICFVGKEY